MVITKEDIIAINKELGGKLMNESSIEYALAAGKEKSLYWRIALLWRAILVDHPFTDVNKRTTLNTTFLMLKRSEIKTDEKAKERITKELLKVAKKNITSIKKIERRIRYAVEGD